MSAPGITTYRVGRFRWEATAATERGPIVNMLFWPDEVPFRFSAFTERGAIRKAMRRVRSADRIAAGKIPVASYSLSGEPTEGGDQ